MTPAEAKLVPELWNLAWAAAARATGAAARSPLPLSDRVWGERLANYHDPELLIGAFDAGELVGAVYGRSSLAAWQAPAVGWLCLLAVTPQWQGTGLGTRLASELVGRLRARGCLKLRFGGEANHLLPGIPQEAPASFWRIARRLGARFLANEHDLHLDLRLALPAAALPSPWRLRDDDPAGAVAFVRREFPGRWAEEVEQRIAAGARALTIETSGEPGGSAPGSSVGPAGKSAGADGFCLAYLGDETLLPPSLNWREQLAASVPSPALVAGIGPLGVAQALRGHQLGLGLVRAAAVWLQQHGATDVIIDWTSLTTFYGKLGARIWRSYQRAEADISGYTAQPDPAAQGPKQDPVREDGRTGRAGEGKPR